MKISAFKNPVIPTTATTADMVPSGQAALLITGALQTAILNSANFSSIATDERGVIQIFNVGAERMLGYAAADVLNKLSPADISDPQEIIARAQALSIELDTPITPGFDALVFKASRGIEDIYELTYIRKDGSRFPALVSVTALRDDQNAIIGYLLIGTDNTARNTAELAESRDAAEAANRAKSIFLATMSHELRTPMNGIMGMTSLALRRATDPKQIDYLGKVAHSSERLLTILSDILDISRIEAGQLTLEDKNFSLAQVVADTLSMQDGPAQAKGLSLSGEIPSTLPDMLCGDSLRLQQILLNFVGNAIKFSEHGGIDLRVFALEEDSHSVMLRIEVTDQGIGLSPEQQTQLFQAFTQADGSATRKYGGAGLGLVLAKRIAKLMDGDVGVISQLGHGSTFWITVRLKWAVDD